MKLSVAIPCYNRSTYLLRAVESVRGQLGGVSDVDVTVVDNCSTEPAMLALLHELEKSGVRVCRGEQNVGPLANWNRCLEVVGGDWLQVLHDDDFVYDGFYAAALSRLREPVSRPLAALAFSAQQVDENDRTTAAINHVLRPGYYEDFSVMQACRNHLCNPAVVFNRKMALEVGGFAYQGPQYVTDWNFGFKLCRRGSIFLDERPLAAYRVHGKSATIQEDFSLGKMMELVDHQLAQIDQKHLSDPHRHDGVAAYGRYLVGFFRAQKQYRIAWRLAKQNFQVSSSMDNVGRTVYKLIRS